MMNEDLINHPPHYTSHPSGVEVLELTRLMPFGPGNAVKYVLRRDLKGKPTDDLGKAAFYLNDSIDHDIDYRLGLELRVLGKRVMDAEPNPNVVSFINALCYTGFDRGFFLGRVPDYELALDLVGVIREAY